MSDQRPVVDDSSIEWKTLTSKKGAQFRVGYSKRETEAGAQSIANEVKAASKEPFSIVVDWPVSNRWVDTTPDVKNTAAIANYNLTSGGVFFEYRLYITNLETYHYYFYDASGDYYGLDTDELGVHYVDYNSSNPTIVQITGS